jgi:molecular chaperone DnaK
MALLHQNHGNSTEKSLSEHGAKLSEDDKAAITKTIEEAKAAMEKEDAEDLTEKVRWTFERPLD